MKYVSLKDSEKKASRLVYGTGNNAIMGDDEGRAKDCIQRAFDHGFTVFDTAYAYGRAEHNFGLWLAGSGRREQVIILDKGCNPGQEGSADEMSQDLIRQQCEESRQRLQTDYVDYYILHRDDPEYPVGAVMEVLNELQEEGKVRHFGVSNWTWQRIREGNKYAADHGLKGFQALSPAYSLAEFVHDPWGRSITLSGAANEKMREAYFQSGLPVFTYSSLARGYLSGKFVTDGDRPIEDCLWWAPIKEYDCPENRQRLHRAEEMARKKELTVSQIALAWLLHQSDNLFPIVSPSSTSHMEEVIQSLTVPLTQKEQNWLLMGQ